VSARALAAIATAGFLSFPSPAAEITFVCRGKVSEATPGGSFKVGDETTDTYVFDDADNTITLFNGKKVKVRASPSAIAAKVDTRPGNTLTFSINRPTGGYVTTLTKSEPRLKMAAEGKCTETGGALRSAGSGTVDGSIYKNPYFGMTIRAPSGWRVFGEKEARQIAGSAKTENIPAMMMVSPPAKGSGAIILLIQQAPSKVALDDVLKLLRKGSAATGSNAELSPVTEESLAGRAFSTYRWASGKERTKYFVRFEKGHALIFTVHYENDDGLREAERSLREMQLG